MKKILAREFLFLLGTAILFFIILFFWIMLNDLNKDREYELENRIEELTEYEKLPYRLRVFYYINKDILKYSNDKMKDSEKFISELQDNKKASEIYDYIQENGSIGISRVKFLERVSKDTNSEKYLAKIQPVELELKETESSVFNNSVQDDKALGLGLILFSLIFLLRYLIYATKWSIKQLRV